MAHLMFKVLCVAYAVYLLGLSTIEADSLQDDESQVFGIGAEDDEENMLRGLLEDDGSNFGEYNAIKSTRQDQEDVEYFLNPGPMIAPNIVVKNYVDARITIANTDDALQKQGRFIGNSVTKDPLRAAFDDKLDYLLNKMSLQQNELFPPTNFSLQNSFNINDLFTPQEPCHMKFNARNGSFDLNFQRDCTTMITAPDAGSRIMLTCSPIYLGDCKTHKDSLTLNLVGDLNFEKNSYFYCGRESSIRAISVRNKLAVRVKKTDDILGSTQCTFHTRKLREFNPSDVNSCGRLGRSSKIVGGRRVPPGLFPWVAQLDITRTDGSQTGCTGSIVSPHYILTAAHCMKRAESISAFMGGTDRQEILGSEVLIQAEKYILHKKWSSKTLLADIALLKLTEPVQYTDDISPICLPEGKLLTEDFAGRRAVAVGWGRTDSKKKAPRKLYRVKLPFLSDSNCRQIYRRFYIPKVMMCTDSKTDSAICYGDSGGPLMYKRQEKVYQIGVASFSLSKNCGESPDVFTKVGEYTSWVKTRISG